MNQTVDNKSILLDKCRHRDTPKTITTIKIINIPITRKSFIMIHNDPSLSPLPITP